MDQSDQRRVAAEEEERCGGHVEVSIKKLPLDQNNRPLGVSLESCTIFFFGGDLGPRDRAPSKCRT